MPNLGAMALTWINRIDRMAGKLTAWRGLATDRNSEKPFFWMEVHRESEQAAVRRIETYG